MSRFRAELFAASWLSYAGFYVTRKVFSVVKGPLKVTLSTDDLGVSFLFTAYLMAYMVGQFLSAWISRRVSNRTQLMAGMGVSIGCNLAIGMLLERNAPPYGAILLLMVVHGLAQATGWPCNVGLMANWTRHPERGRVMAVWSTCYQLGAVFGKAFAAFVFGWLGLVWSFWASSAVLAAIVALFYFWGREKPEDAGLEPFEGEASRSPLNGRAMFLRRSIGLDFWGFSSPVSGRTGALAGAASRSSPRCPWAVSCA